ncbi:ABC transporter permease [Natrinema ejinorense]|uniref:ABC transporter n=1 Tax=Natrinema ejinorense TaxID=373386 RepID=A0A2A5QQQ3_9EURY|nr:ABC transporter permease [Natrinema ejinorense]PCR89188.1 ABC transporter [Natrinema ejinorense]
MSTLDVARKDFLDVRRSKIVWFVAGLYAFFMILMIYFGQTNVPNPDIKTALRNLTGIGAMFIPLIALVSAYLAIAGERESGGVKYLLSIPNSRRDVVFGKYLTRAAVVTISILAAFLLSAGFAVRWYPSLEIETFVGVAVLTVLYALTYIAVAIGISAATASRSRAMGGAIGFFFVTNVLNLFGPLRLAINYVLNDLAGLDIAGNQIMFVQSVLSPTASYVNATDLVFPDSFRAVQSDVPWFLEGEMMVAILLGWIVVPIVLGLWRFERADLS